MHRTGVAALLIAAIVTSSQAEEGILPPAQHLLQVWPALSATAETPQPKSLASSMEQPEGKSPRRAFLFSAVLPGAGEFYAGAEKRAIAFGAIEAVALGLYFTWNGKGNDIEKEFRAMADTSWNPQDYLQWRDPAKGPIASSITHALPCSSLVAEGDWLKNLKGCGSREKQQYYELIGKYHQFIAGWKDAVDRNGARAQPTEITSADSFYSKLRGRCREDDEDCEGFKSYEDRRNDSNQYLKRATYMLSAVLVNHVLSAIDASHIVRNSRQSQTALERRMRLALVLPPERQRPAMLMMYKPFY